MSDPSPYAGARPIGDALVRLIDDIEPGELLGWITPERLGAAAGFSASTVRYRLGQVERTADVGAERPTAWAFDRSVLLEVMADALFARLIETSRESVLAQLPLIRRAVAESDIALFAEAMVDDFERFSPGATPEDSGGGAERARLLILTACEGSPTLSRLVRDRYADWLAAYDPVYVQLLELTRRQLRPGSCMADVALPISMFLQGLAERRRFDPAMDPVATLRGFLALFCATTDPIDGAQGSVDELLARLEADRVRRAAAAPADEPRR